MMSNSCGNTSFADEGHALVRPNPSGSGAVYRGALNPELPSSSSMSKWICILCSESTMEPGSWQQGKTYSLTEEEQSKAKAYLRCDKCKRLHCYLCLEEIFKLRGERYPEENWSKIVGSFLREYRKQATWTERVIVRTQPGSVLSCCELTALAESREPISKSLKIKQQQRRTTNSFENKKAPPKKAPQAAKLEFEGKKAVIAFQKRKNTLHNRKRKKKQRLRWASRSLSSDAMTPATGITLPTPMSSTTVRPATTTGRHVPRLEKDKEGLDISGYLFFPFVGDGLLIPSNTYTQTLSITGQDVMGTPCREKGLKHMVVSPENGRQLASQGVSPRNAMSTHSTRRNADTDAIDATFELYNEIKTIAYIDPIANVDGTPRSTKIVKAHIIVLNSTHGHGFIPLKDQEFIYPNGTTSITLEQANQASVYLSKRSLKKDKKRNVDVVLLFCTPVVCEEGNLHLIANVDLSDACPVQTEDESQEVYDTLWSFGAASKEGFVTNRIGGSNGSVEVGSDLFQLMRRSGSTPRQSGAVVFQIDRRVLKYYYIQGYRCDDSKKKGRYVCSGSYCNPKEGVAFTLTERKYRECGPTTKSFLIDFSRFKAETAPLLHAINKKIFAESAIRQLRQLACVDSIRIQCMTNAMARLYAWEKLKNVPNPTQVQFEEHFFSYLVTTCGYSVLAYPVGIHVDTPSFHAFFDSSDATPERVEWIKKYKVESFIENKKLIVVKSKQGNKNGLGLGRSGLGNGAYVVVILDHSLRASNISDEEVNDAVVEARNHDGIMVENVVRNVVDTLDTGTA